MSARWLKNTQKLKPQAPILGPLVSSATCSHIQTKICMTASITNLPTMRENRRRTNPHVYETTVGATVQCCTLYKCTVVQYNYRMRQSNYGGGENPAALPSPNIRIVVQTVAHSARSDHHLFKDAVIYQNHAELAVSQLSWTPGAHASRPMSARTDGIVNVISGIPEKDAARRFWIFRPTKYVHEKILL